MKLNIVLVLSLLVQALWLPPAFAGEKKVQVPFIEAKSEPIQHPSGGRPLTLETKQIMPQDQAQLETAVEWAAKELKKTESKERNIVLVHEEGRASDQRKLEQASEEVLEELSKRTTSSKEINIVKTPLSRRVIDQARSASQTIKEGFYKHERITLTLIKGSVNGAITGTALVMSVGVPLMTALPIAIFTGTVSGAFMYFNAKFQRFMDGDPAKKQRLLESGRLGSLKHKTLQMGRNLLANTGVFIAVNAVSALAGVPTGGFLHESIKVLRSSIASTASGGVWSTAIASNTRDQINQSSSPSERQRIQFRSNMIGLGVSMVGSFGSILTLMGTSLGYWTMGAIGVTGLLYTIKSYMKNRNNNSNTGRSSLSREQHSRVMRSCRSVFSN